MQGLLGKLFCICLALLGLAAFGADWPQWRGTGRNGMSEEKGLLTQWPEGGPPLAWRASGLGRGYSTVSVVGNKIFTMGDVDEAQHIIAVNRGDGKLLWKTKVGPIWKDGYGGPRGTPTVDGAYLYAIGTEGDLYCLDVKNGNVRWHKNLVRDFGGRMSAGRGVHWKFSESPLIDGDKIIVTPGVNSAAQVALNKKTGAEIWRTEMPVLGEKGADGAGYASVMISNGGGIRQYVQLLGRGVIGVEAKTGRFLWGYNRIANDVANIATPIIHGDFVFVSTGYNTGAALLKLSPEDNGIKAEEVYYLDPEQMQNHHGGLILKDGFLYTGTGHNKGFPLCVNMKTGETAWGPIENEGKGSAAVTFADGHLYFRYQNGLMVLVEASSKGYKEKGSFMIPDVNQFSWAHPVISDGKLYLREQDNLFCYNVRK